MQHWKWFSRGEKTWSGLPWQHGLVASRNPWQFRTWHFRIANHLPNYVKRKLIYYLRQCYLTYEILVLTFIMNLVKKQMKNLGGQDIQSEKQEKSSTCKGSFYSRVCPVSSRPPRPQQKSRSSCMFSVSLFC